MVEILTKELSPLRTVYPFKSNTIKIGNNKLHYIDEGEGEVILMLHGNPTWSFYYRNLVRTFKRKYRLIVPDHMGCGLSDKPKDYAYTLENHISNVLLLLHHLDIKKFTLMVHDWGGAIGFGVATRHPEYIKKIVILNTAAFRSQSIPKRIAFCRTKVGGFLVQALNLFAWPATFMTTTKPLAPIIKTGYLLPYDSFDHRIAIRRFVEDIPLKQEDESYATLLEIESKLPFLTCPKLILWGGKDFCFTIEFFKKWLEIYPDAESIFFENAGHYVLEDELPAIVLKLKDFLRD